MVLLDHQVKKETQEKMVSHSCRLSFLHTCYMSSLHYFNYNTVTFQNMFACWSVRHCKHAQILVNICVLTICVSHTIAAGI